MKTLSVRVYKIHPRAFRGLLQLKDSFYWFLLLDNTKLTNTYFD